MHWAVSGFAGSGGVAAAGLCLVLREAERTGPISQHRGQSESLPGEASRSDEQHQKQSPCPHCTTGGTRCYDCVCACMCVHRVVKNTLGYKNYYRYNGDSFPAKVT